MPDKITKNKPAKKPTMMTPKNTKKLTKRKAGFFKINSKTVNTNTATTPKPAMKEKRPATIARPSLDSTNPAEVPSQFWIVVKTQYPNKNKNTIFPALSFFSRTNKGAATSKAVPIVIMINDTITDTNPFPNPVAVIIANQVA